MKRKVPVSEICRALGVPYVGNDVEINGLNLCNRVSRHDRVLSYAVNGEYVDVIRANQAVACIVLHKNYLGLYQNLCQGRELTFVLCEKPEEIFYQIHSYLYHHTDFYEKYDFASEIGEGCTVHPSAVIENGVMIGKNVTIGANTVVRKGTVIEDGCSIGCNSTIGSEGFQVIKLDGTNHKIVHCGGVLLCDHACVGDNVTICNSLFEDTARIGRNVMIDNHAYVGHNVLIGDNAVVTAGTVLCGSSVVEDNAWVGVNSSVLNKVCVGSGSKVGIGSVVTRDIPDGSLAYGVPAKVRMVFGGVER